MVEATFLIPENDRNRVQGLRAVAGIEDIRVTHKPFDPFSADAEAQVVAEAVVTVSYDPVIVDSEHIKAAFVACHIHILDVQTDE